MGRVTVERKIARSAILDATSRKAMMCASLKKKRHIEQAIRRTAGWTSFAKGIAMRHTETTIDIVLRRTNRKWLGIVQIDGREVYRTWDYHDTKESALERADAWFKESMQGGNLEALFKQIIGTSNTKFSDEPTNN